MNKALSFLAVVTLAGIAGEAFGVGLDLSGNCAAPRINCIERGQGFDDALDAFRELIQSFDYRCDDDIDAVTFVDLHRGRAFVVQCGYTGLRYFIQMYSDDRVSVRPTQMDWPGQY